MTYRIRNWGKHFENNRTREMVKMSWVPVPNKHDGEGFATIMAEDDGLKIYACWHLILQVASKCEPRGTLLRDDRTPHTARSICVKTRCSDVAAMQRALDFLSSPQVAWLEHDTENPAPSCAEGNRIEGKGIERKGKDAHEEALAETPPTPLAPDLDRLAVQVYGATPTANLSEAVKFHGEATVKKAILETEKCRKRHWSYTLGILKRWAREGMPKGRDSPPTDLPIPPPGTYYVESDGRRVLRKVY